MPSFACRLLGRQVTAASPALAVSAPARYMGIRVCGRTRAPGYGTTCMTGAPMAQVLLAKGIIQQSLARGEGFLAAASQ